VTSKLAWLHSCGTAYTDSPSRCPGCAAPLMVLPSEMVTLALDTERVTALRVSLLGVIGAAYMRGWEDRDQADGPVR